ncbi:MAG: carboxymuconolactone decarboxylase [Phycisphaerae bacterium]|nr:carboxymuconolactone decarboxylase [Phycisphaerae bacterium]
MFNGLMVAAVAVATVAASGVDGQSEAPRFETSRGFAIHSVASAPEASRESIEWFVGNLGFVPNLVGVMSESPALIRSYATLQQSLLTHSSLSPADVNVVQFAMAYENECQYCVAGHTLGGKAVFKNTDAEIAALRTGSKLPTPKQDALRRFTLDVYESKGRVTSEQFEAFLAAGYSRQDALDVVAGIAAKVMTNFTNQVALTPLDEPLAPLAEGLPFAEDRATLER